jgi:ATP-dependent Clp protease ATP-binding subunit ClpC
MALTKKDIVKSRIYPVLGLEAVVSERNFNRLLKVLKALFFTFAIVTLGVSLLLPRILPNAIDSGRFISYKLFGVLCLDLALLLIAFMLRAYLRSSYYFENVLLNRYTGHDLYTFTVGRILCRTRGDDWLAGFLRSDTGQIIMMRSGLNREQIENFLATRTKRPLELTLSADRLLKLKDFTLSLYEQDPDFSRLFQTAGFSKEDLSAVVDWAVRDIEEQEMRTRFWRRENLDRIGSLGKEWSYGYTPLLDKFSTDLLGRPESAYSPFAPSFRDQEVRRLEEVLARATGSNVLLIADNETVRMDVLWSFARKVRRGTILESLEHKRVILFDTALFLSSFKERSALEQATIEIFSEAARAGDVILVLNDLPGFLAQAAAAGAAGIFGLIEPYLKSSRLQVIALADTDQFHRELESRPELMTRFERLIVPELSVKEAVSNLLTSIDQIEAELNQQGEKLRFSYPGLKQIVASADSYFGDGDLADKSRDLVSELVPWAVQRGIYLILPRTVTDYVSEKMAIPAGAIGSDEKVILQNLDGVLRTRVVGQERALVAVAGALKRARAGIVNEKRPLGSFLFLGPTGVGKTETAKALAFAYFGTEEKLLRLDMTEYQDSSAVEKLIGSFSTGQTGVLSNLIRQNIFGVLLLDEFEKTAPEVQDLFLQILDEGFFSDMNGKKVNTRNMIFIATSNAGAGDIWTAVKAGQDPALDKDRLIDGIVSAGTFKPELLNRFDDIVIFHPLGQAELERIARLMLEKLAKRLEAKGVKLAVNDQLAQIVAAEGANELFGARPMNRYIQDKIEQPIAERIIDGSVQPGKTVAFSVGDGNSLSTVVT